MMTQESLFQNVFLIQFISSLFMLGLIWFVQVVHYPLFKDVPPEHFPNYSQRHQWLTTWVVGPVMLIEAFSALYLSVKFEVLWLNFLLLLLIWLSTACLQIPLHGKLTHQYDMANIESLVLSNWVRTLLWTGKTILLTLFLIELLSLRT